jgi:hypothetical protein
MTTANPRFVVAVLAQNSRNFDGSPIVERDCGHKHRTLTGACRCFEDLTRETSRGSRTYRADFYHAQVRRADGPLTEDEQDEVREIVNG